MSNVIAKWDTPFWRAFGLTRVLWHLNLFVATNSSEKQLREFAGKYDNKDKVNAEVPGHPTPTATIK